MGGKKKGKKPKPAPELPLAAPPPEPMTRPDLPLAAPGPVQGPMMEPEVICKLKTIEFGGAARTIVYPPRPRHRSALLALVNALLLSGDLAAGIDAPNHVPLQHFLLRMARRYGRLLKNHHREASQKHIMDTIKCLSRPIDISVCFRRIDGIVSNSVDLEIFGNMGIGLYHLWIADSQDAAVATAVGTDYYEIFRALYPYETSVPIPNADQPVLDFLQGTGLTAFGLQELNNTMKNDQTSVVFWDKTFHTIIKHNGGLYALHNDLRSFETDVLWKELKVEGDGRFCNSNFVPVVAPVIPTTQVEDESQPAWEQLDKPGVPALDTPKIIAALTTSSQLQKHKCIRRNCPLHFHSILNLHRHKQLHLKCHKAKMDSVNTTDIAKFWDQLSDEDSKELLSIKNEAAINNITGDSIYQFLEEIGRENDFYGIANKLKSIIDSSEKVSSEDLIAALEEASEKTAFSTDIQRYPDYSIFDRVLPLLCEVSETIACCSYFLERSLMEKWFEQKEEEVARSAAILLDEEAESSSSGKYGCTPDLNSGINYNWHKPVHSSDFNPVERFLREWRSILERNLSPVKQLDDNLSRDVGITDLPEVGGEVSGGVGAEGYLHHLLVPQSPIAVRIHGRDGALGAQRVVDVYEHDEPAQWSPFSVVERAEPHWSWLSAGRHKSYTLAASSAVSGRQSQSPTCPTVEERHDDFPHVEDVFRKLYSDLVAVMANPEVGRQDMI